MWVKQPRVYINPFQPPLGKYAETVSECLGFPGVPLDHGSFPGVSVRTSDNGYKYLPAVTKGCLMEVRGAHYPLT